MIYIPAGIATPAVIEAARKLMPNHPVALLLGPCEITLPPDFSPPSVLGSDGGVLATWEKPDER